MNQPEKQVRWRSLIAEQKGSSQNVARTRGLHETLFYYWKKQLQEVARSQFLEVPVAKPDLSQRHCGAALGSTIEVRLRNGRILMVRPSSPSRESVLERSTRRPLQSINKNEERMSV
jgi:hypothetical protein